MEKKCQDCKHWEKRKEYGYIPDQVRVGLGECTKAKAFWQCSDWVKPDYVREMLPEFKDLKMFVQDMSDCSAHLWTRPDFYCYHFEAK